jgi:hypothetical protein
MSGNLVDKFSFVSQSENTGLSSIIDEEMAYDKLTDDKLDTDRPHPPSIDPLGKSPIDTLHAEKPPH